MSERQFNPHNTNSMPSREEEARRRGLSYEESLNMTNVELRVQPEVVLADEPESAQKLPIDVALDESGEFDSQKARHALTEIGAMSYRETLEVPNVLLRSYFEAPANSEREQPQVEQVAEALIEDNEHIKSEIKALHTEVAVLAARLEEFENGNRQPTMSETAEESASDQNDEARVESATSNEAVPPEASEAEGLDESLVASEAPAEDELVEDSSEVLDMPAEELNKSQLSSEVIADSGAENEPQNEIAPDPTVAPEIHEAQDNHDIEQTMQPQPAKELDDARQKVSEVFGGTGEKEQSILIDEVARAAKDTTRIYTDIPKDVMLKSDSGDYRPTDGFNSFGDGLSQNNRHYKEKLEYSGSAEALLFEPDTTTRYKTVTETIKVGKRFKKKTEQVEKQVPDGEVPVMVTNPATGQQEPGVKVAYQFNGNDRREGVQTIYYEGPKYATENGRSGNQLWVEATLPKSVADKLRQEAVHNPEVAREFAKTLAFNNGITEQIWNDGVRPPFDEVPNDWAMAVVDLQKDTQFGDVRHKAASQQVVRIR